MKKKKSRTDSSRADHMKPYRFKVKGTPLAKVPLSVRLPQEIDDFLRSRPDRNQIIREILVAGLEPYLKKEESSA